MKIGISGKYQDTIKNSKSLKIINQAVRSNVIVYRTMDLIADLLRNEPDLNGISHIAVGTGGQTNPQPPETELRRNHRLVKEIYRKALIPESDIKYDDKTRTITIKATFKKGEAVGSLNEFGLFGGDASARRNTGHLINYAVHPVLEKKDEDVLDREIQLKFQSDKMLNSALALISILLCNRPGTQGISYFAVGVGNKKWDETPPKFNRGLKELKSEIYRKPLRRSQNTAYDQNTRNLMVRTTFEYDEAEKTLRECGIFGGNATLIPGSGYLLSYNTHKAINKEKPLDLEHEISLLIGTEATARVPNLIGLSQKEARNEIDKNNFRPGAVREIELNEQIGAVVNQHPEADKLVPAGSYIDIWIAIATKIKTPNLISLKKVEASDVLEKAGLKLSDEVPAEEESKATPETIIRQIPAAGALVKPDSIVEIALAVPITVTVPDLIGLKEGAVAVLLAKAGLILPSPPRTKGSDGNYGTVIQQDPVAGKKVPVDTKIVITLAAPWVIEVPNIIGKNPEEAAESLQKSASELLEELNRPPLPPGLVLGIQKPVESAEEKDTIIQQTPEPEEEAPLYGTVDVEIAAPQKVNVPDLIGLTEIESKNSLEKAGLALGKIARRPDVSKTNTVIKQDPRPDTTVFKGTPVGIVLADAILVKVPDLVDHHLKYAREVISSRGLKLKKIQPPVEDETRVWVEKQKPEAGKMIALNSEITLELAVRVPNLIGLTPPKAKGSLESLGLTLNDDIGQEFNEEPAGKIIKQTPEAGSMVVPNSEVAVVVAARVPNIVDKTLAKAKKMLSDAGLALADKIGQEVNEKPAGTIIRQNPKAGAAKAPGKVVHVVVAARVPNIIGSKLDKAVAVLEEVGLALGEVKYRISDKPVEKIVDQKPEAGSVAVPGTQVLVHIAARVPDLSGKTPAQAKKILAEYGLDLADIINQEVSDRPKGKIFRQNPEAGSIAAPENVVKVVIAARVPDLFGKTFDQAKKVAATVGLTLSSEIEREVSDRPKETIIRQIPEAGATKAPNNQISIVLAARVPAIIGLKLDKAQATIEAVSLVMGKIQNRISEKAVNTVLEQKPEAGAVAVPNSAVDVVVAARVPDLSGRTPAQAKKMLSAVGLALSDDTAQKVSDKPQGRIVAQIPKAGATQAPRDVVSVVIAARVPNIIGRLPAQAKKILSEVRLQLSDQIAHEVSEKPKGTIIQQSPAAGATRAPGNIVTVVLAARVPDVVGLTLEKARPILTAVGLVLGAVKKEVGNQPEGTIIAQNPRSGSIAARGQKVSVVVSVKQTVAVPNIVRLHVDVAQPRLKEIGLDLKIAEQQVSPLPVGTILGQRPGPRTRVPVGTVVDVAVSRGPR